MAVVASPRAGSLSEAGVKVPSQGSSFTEFPADLSCLGSKQPRMKCLPKAFEAVKLTCMWDVLIVQIGEKILWRGLGRTGRRWS